MELSRLSKRFRAVFMRDVADLSSLVALVDPARRVRCLIETFFNRRFHFSPGEKILEISLNFFSIWEKTFCIEKIRFQLFDLIKKNKILV